MLPFMDKPAAMDTFRALTWEDLCAGAYFYLDDKPAGARWLNDADKRELQAVLDREEQAKMQYL